MSLAIYVAYAPLIAAESGDQRVVIISAITGCIGVVGTKLADFIWTWVKENKGTKTQERKDIIDHLNERVDRLERDNATGAKRQRKQSNRLRVVENSNTQMLAHIMYLEHLIRTKGGIDFAEYKEIPLPPVDDEEDTGAQSGTDLHKPLPQTGGT